MPSSTTCAAAGRKTLHALFFQRVSVSEARAEVAYWEGIHDALQSASATKEDGTTPRYTTRRIASKANVARVALTALRTRWGRRYRTYSESQRAPLPEEDVPLPAGEAPPEPRGRLNPKLLTEDEQRQLAALLRKARVGTPED